MKKCIIYGSKICPKCQVLKMKLQSKEIDFQEITDVQIMESKGIIQIPVLECEQGFLDFAAAVQWVNKE